MNYPKAILIIHPLIGPRTSYLNWFQGGYQIIALYPELEKIPANLLQGLAGVDFAVKIQSTGDLNKDLQLIREQFQYYDVVYGYMGWESTISYGEQILRALFPHCSNDPNTSVWRYSKYAMNERVQKYGLPNYIKQCRVQQENITPEVEKFLTEVKYPVVVKPGFNSAASDKVFFSNNIQEAKEHIHVIGGVGLLGPVSEIIIQEKISGIEYSVDTFSHAGQHEVSAVLMYEKGIIDNMPIYRAATIIDPDHALYPLLTEHVKKIITALGVEYGMGHTEVMVTPQNEVKLIELNLRPSGFGGYINDVVYDHQQVNQFTLAINWLNKKKTEVKNDGKTQVFFLLNNLGFTYKEIKINLLENMKSYRDVKIMKKTCDKKPEKILLFDTVAIIHLANHSPSKLREDMDLLEQYEKDGTLFG